MKIYNFNVVICWDWSVLKSFNYVAVLSWWGSHKTSASSEATRDGFQISVFKNMWDGMLHSWNNYPSWEWYEHPRNASLFSIKSILWSKDYYIDDIRADLIAKSGSVAIKVWVGSQEQHRLLWEVSDTLTTFVEHCDYCNSHLTWANVNC